MASHKKPTHENAKWCPYCGHGPLYGDAGLTHHIITVHRGKPVEEGDKPEDWKAQVDGWTIAYMARKARALRAAREGYTPRRATKPTEPHPARHAETLTVLAPPLVYCPYCGGALPNARAIRKEG